MKTTKSPRRLLVEAHRIAEAALPPYAHRNNPRVYTQYQLFACLVLKDFCNLTYRGVVALLKDCAELAAAIALAAIPHFTTLQKAADRLLISRPIRRLLDATVHAAIERRVLQRRPRLTAVDTSGFESQHTSRYDARRRKTSGKHGRKRRVSYRRFPKLGVLCDTASHLILAARTSQGPRPDFGDFAPLLRAPAQNAHAQNQQQPRSLDRFSIEQACPSQARRIRRRKRTFRNGLPSSSIGCRQAPVPDSGNTR